ncbi:MAG TPA: hypothetical protein VHX17_08310 [Candidatus Cybelea sp.]|jgi:hypothetical protein|nr:hypothetical protein [Candidatus Cybelea sp.]
MLLTSLLLSVVALNPAMAPRAHMGPTEGTISAGPFSPDKVCKPGDICASKTVNQNGCFYANFWNKSNGGTPLTIDVTQTGSSGSNTYIYWVNSTNKNISIAGSAMAKFYCP